MCHSFSPTPEAARVRGAAAVHGVGAVHDAHESVPLASLLAARLQEGELPVARRGEVQEDHACLLILVAGPVDVPQDLKGRTVQGQGVRCGRGQGAAAAGLVFRVRLKAVCFEERPARLGPRDPCGAVSLQPAARRPRGLPQGLSGFPPLRPKEREQTRERVGGGASSRAMHGCWRNSRAVRRPVTVR